MLEGIIILFFHTYKYSIYCVIILTCAVLRLQKPLESLKLPSIPWKGIHADRNGRVLQPDTIIGKGGLLMWKAMSEHKNALMQFIESTIIQIAMWH